MDGDGDGDGDVTVFADTNLGTRIAFNAPPDITAASLKRDFEKAHFSCLPDIGEIQVNGLMVKRKSYFYYLPDSLPMKYAFPAMRGTWFLHVEVKHLKCLCISCSPSDAAVLSKHKDLTTCNSEDKAKHNNEEEKMEGFQTGAYLVKEHEATNHVSKEQVEKGISHENHTQNVATGMSERYPSRFGDKSTGTANEIPCAMPENKVENLVELHTNSMHGSLSKMSTQVISVTGIINKYFSGFNGIDKYSSSSNSDVTSRAAHSEIEVHSNTKGHSCSKRQSDSLSQFTPKTPPHVFHAPLHVDLVPKKLGGKTRKSKVGKHLTSGSKNRKAEVGKHLLSGGKNSKSKIGNRLLVASRSIGVSATKHDPTLSLCRFRDRKLLQDKSQINGSIFSISDSDD
ncbi:uncharacterized protein LOC109803199 [Cajanus cajan]|uniref:Uncharacterized protein n=1 Tax=Cajanus cajan TaxID=3821 RepID=A0A151T5K1_CAJCA|nr:uncharacterized protein LOC109803199 [Cajanus cajan]KYP62332.1 hypothetical protein KK1_016864 [Cajanus cajan]